MDIYTYKIEYTHAWQSKTPKSEQWLLWKGKERIGIEGDLEPMW